ncbi:arylformamidase [Oceanobacillus profundus]|uniref:arylformamidase n=1 Tax=Oceanobacillus profundus TaxID=372463 RepID=UPI000BA575DA|nr:arylformamidase [Oceanobacillus profundus]MBR3118014.1 arylformamidase [Oceanobacillus sp.]MCM3400284.1 arylformamidase [Oceanobacillus profundus]PAE27493.1 arylformamidase [Paenibacillus sp. 7884-2]
MSKWIDISQALTNDIAHWPGDTPFNYKLSATKEQTGSANIGEITTSLHIGTHIDAPFHFNSNGKTVDQLDLDLYIGKAIVIDVSHTDNITAAVLENYQFDYATRLLLRTSLPNNPKRFPREFPYLDPEIAQFLSEKGIQLLGVDIPSVDAPDSKELTTHHALHRHGIHILENIMLKHVIPGSYDLIALPLAIHGADGSPVRAVLRPLKENES